MHHQGPTYIVQLRIEYLHLLGVSVEYTMIQSSFSVEHKITQVLMEATPSLPGYDRFAFFLIPNPGANDSLFTQRPIHFSPRP